MHVHICALPYALFGIQMDISLSESDINGGCKETILLLWFYDSIILWVFKFITGYFCKTPWTLNLSLCLDLEDAGKLQKPHYSFSSSIIVKGSLPKCSKQIFKIVTCFFLLLIIIYSLQISTIICFIDKYIFIYI